jgi:hypothetical protein
MKFQNLQFESVYSDTDQPDKQGRWMRKCYFNKAVLIATVTRLEHEHLTVYTVHTFFPVNMNVDPLYIGRFDNYRAAQRCIADQWELFCAMVYDGNERFRQYQVQNQKDMYTWKKEQELKNLAEWVKTLFLGSALIAAIIFLLKWISELNN